MRALNSPHHRDGDVYHDPAKSINRGNCFLAPEISGKTKDVAKRSNMHKWGSHGTASCPKVTRLIRDRRLSTFLSSSSQISSHLPAQPLRQQHFCMEQQLQLPCEGGPFDVLYADNAQRCLGTSR